MGSLLNLPLLEWRASLWKCLNFLDCNRIVVIEILVTHIMGSLELVSFQL